MSIRIRTRQDGPGAADESTTTMAYWRAVNSALRETLAADERVFLIGEDMTKWGTGGGIYGVTKGLVDEFGPQRVRDTPISEEAIVAVAVGAALRGMRPIVEIMYSDFMLLAMDPIVNQAAKARYMFGGQFDVPLVIRTNGGSGGGKAAQHSQSLETIFAHVPGLEVVVPGTPGDAYGLLLSAVASPNPTIFLEHKALYNDRGSVGNDPIPLGSAAVVRPGGDVTVVATQLVRRRVLEAAEVLAVEGIEVELIDPRTLYPLDTDTIVRSVAKTGHLLVAHEAPEMYGWGAEVVARVVREGWTSLRSAPQVLGGARTPVPYAENLEQAVMPSAEQVVAAVRHLLGL
ncbi:MAG: pyruvate dehydrogenase complex E1 component subunit beta [Candidatus Limnocylindrales bacterium]|jgi:pyruvate dehydrogenase E1 component beta subunit